MTAEIARLQNVIVKQKKPTAATAGSALGELFCQKSADGAATDQGDALAGQGLQPPEVAGVEISLVHRMPSVARQHHAVRLPEQVRQQRFLAVDEEFGRVECARNVDSGDGAAVRCLRRDPPPRPFSRTDNFSQTPTRIRSGPVEPGLERPQCRSEAKGRRDQMSGSRSERRRGSFRTTAECFRRNRSGALA